MHNLPLTLSNSGKAVSYVARFQIVGSQTEITFPAFGRSEVTVPKDGDLAVSARAFLNDLLAQKITSRDVVPAPDGPAGRIADQSYWYQAVVPDQTIALKSLLWDRMRSEEISNSDLARRLEIDEKEVRRLLDTTQTHKSRLYQAVEVVTQAPVAVTVVDTSRPTRMLRTANQTGGHVPNLTPTIASATPLSAT